jgi:hypothetical protein
MSFESSIGQLAQPKCVLPSQLFDPALRGRKIERLEFEQLLQRAMEIVNARDLAASLAEGQKLTRNAGTAE